MLNPHATSAVGTTAPPTEYRLPSKAKRTQKGSR
jgi:hypothetical protein